MSLSRRSLLGMGTAGLAVAAGATLGGQTQAKPFVKLGNEDVAKGNSKVDVVVIGAGVSGLIAARDIERQGRTTTVLEAAPRLGGRCQRQQTTKTGGWISATNG
jgi:NADPH-dependent 2,4-dienoyl-CoA reductase/sulfur reductase-like enzyme